MGVVYCGHKQVGIGMGQEVEVHVGSWVFRTMNFRKHFHLMNQFVVSGS